MTTETPNTTQDASPSPQTGAANPGSTEAKFTQADLERLIEERVGRAEKRDAKIKADLLKQLGLAEDADFTTVKATIDDARKRKQDELTEAQKAQAERDEEKKKRETLEAQLNAERTQWRSDLITAAVKEAAKTLNATDTDDVLRYARDKHAETLAAVMSEDGQIDATKVTALLEKIKTEKAHYFQKAIGGAGIPSNQGQRAAGNSRDLEKAAQSLRREIRRW